MAGEPCFDWATERLAIGGCPRLVLGALASEHAIGAVIDLRDEDCDDGALLAANDVALLHLPTPDHCTIAPAALREGVAFAHRHFDEGRRVLIHCQHGIGRSALLALCVLCHSGWAPLDALERLKAVRSRVSPSQAQYEGWAAWLRRAGAEPPSFDAFAAVAYRHLA